MFVATAQKQLHEERFRICRELWDADVKVREEKHPDCLLINILRNILIPYRFRIRYIYNPITNLFAVFVVHPSMLVWCPHDGMWLNAVGYTMPIFNKGLDWLGDPYHPTGQRLFGARKVTPGEDALTLDVPLLHRRCVLCYAECIYTIIK